MCCGLNNQADFLLALGFKDSLKESLSQEAGEDMINTVKKESFLTHKLLIEMGLKFKVLIQRKGTVKQDLLGLKFW
jgi:SAM-dependent MidA family methyltransferase